MKASSEFGGVIRPSAGGRTHFLQGRVRLLDQLVEETAGLLSDGFRLAGGEARADLAGVCRGLELLALREETLPLPGVVSTSVYESMG